MKYIIAWQSKITGHTSEGTTSYTGATIDPMIRELNQKWPEIKHWRKAA